MDGAALSPAELTAISRLPSRNALYGQLVGLVASPLSGLARTLNALVGGLAVALGGVLEQREAAAPTPAAAAAVEAVAEPDAEQPPAEEAAEPAAAEEVAEPAAAEEAAEQPAAEATTTKRRMRNGYQHS